MIYGRRTPLYPDTLIAKERDQLPSWEKHSGIPRYSLPAVLVFPPSVAHGSVSLLVSAVCGQVCPQRLCSAPVIRMMLQLRRDGIHHTTLRQALRPLQKLLEAGATTVSRREIQHSEAPLDVCTAVEGGVNRISFLGERIARAVHPNVAPQHVFVASSTCAILDAFLLHLHLDAGSTVYVPGLLLYPHTQIYSVIRSRQLHAVGYDIHFDSMQVDLQQLQQVASSRCSLAADRGDHYTSRGTPLIILAGIRGRFLTNAAAVRSIAKERGWLVVELHASTVQMNSEDHPHNGHADVHITSFDGMGFLGGAVGYARDVNVADSVGEYLNAMALPPRLQLWLRILKYAAHLLLSNRMDYSRILFTMTVLTAAWRAFCRVLWNDRGSSAYEKEGLLNWWFSSQVKAIDALSRLAASQSAGQTNAMSTSGNPPVQHGRSTVVYIQPLHRVQLQWLDGYVKQQQRRSDAECYSLWDFLHQLPKYVDVISAGEPQHPERCVEIASDGLVLRVAFPGHLCRVLAAHGFAATPATPVEYSEGVAPLKTVYASDVVYMPGCTECSKTAKQLVFVPLTSGMPPRSRRRLLRCLRELPPHLFTYASGGTSSVAGRYVSPQVDSLLTQLRQKYGGCANCSNKEGSTVYNENNIREHTERALLRERSPLLTYFLYGVQGWMLLSKL